MKLLWSRRIGDAPGTPSRWVHRLLMILETAKLKTRFSASDWPAFARRLSEPVSVTPIAMPKPKPPVALRPKGLSVTRIERLVRDPYAIYARHVLMLEPLKPIASAPESLRWSRAPPTSTGPAAPRSRWTWPTPWPPSVRPPRLPLPPLRLLPLHRRPRVPTSHARSG